MIVFFLFFLIELNTPFHSDDFWYYQIGNSFSSHINHYLTWSGRVVADYASTILLHLNHTVVSVVIAILGTLNCFLIADIPNKIFRIPFSKVKFIFLFCLYWLSHPDIGEGVFWVVGSCNYLLTTCFVLLFLYLFVIFKNTDNKIIISLLFVLSVFAGCSNENTCISVFFVFFLLLFFWTSHRIEFSRGLVIMLITGLIIGASILIFSPGNFARLDSPLYADWRAASVYDKLVIHIVRFRKTFNYVFIILIVVLCYVIYKNRENGKYTDNVRLSFIFLLTSLVAYFILFVSPSMPRRAFTSVYTFQLLALSSVLCLNKLKNILNLISKVFFCFVSLMFCLSYASVLYSYSVTKNQEAIRNEHIRYEINRNQKSLEIPSYYFVGLLRKRDDFDPLQSSAHSSFVNVDELFINPVSCDYSIINDPGNIISVVNKSNLPITQAFYKKHSFFRSSSQLIVESMVKFPDNFSIVGLDTNNSKTNNINFDNFFKLKDRYYVGVSGSFDDISAILIE